jgi:hypothetical protein
MKYRGITHKLDELNRELRNRKIDIAVISETKKKSKGSKELENYVMIYSGVPREEWDSSGVAILVRNDWKNRIIDYKWISSRIVQLRLKILTYTVTIIGIYAPVEGKPTH